MTRRTGYAHRAAIVAELQRRKALGMRGLTFDEIAGALPVHGNNARAYVNEIVAGGAARRVTTFEAREAAPVQYFAIELHDGQARLVPLSEVRADVTAGADTSLFDSPGALASGALSEGEA